VTTEPTLDDIFTEPEADVNTLANLGPLAPLAGVWAGTAGTDVHPVVDGLKTQEYTERFELQPIDPQTNGPQLFYGLRYHQHIVKPGEHKTFHDQVGYLLWEPATGAVHMTLAIPRAQVAMASGLAEPDSTTFTLHASAGDPNAGIVSNPYLDEAFHTPSWEITFRIGPGDTWSYEQTTMLNVHGRGPFDHHDTSTLVRIGDPMPNPLAGG
jgi:hypothetical protein